jgi:hypothetical protein
MIVSLGQITANIAGSLLITRRHYIPKLVRGTEVGAVGLRGFGHYGG